MKKNHTFRIDQELLSELQTFVRDYRGKPLYVDMGSIVEAGIKNEIKRLTAKLNQQTFKHSQP